MFKEFIFEAVVALALVSALIISAMAWSATIASKETVRLYGQCQYEKAMVERDRNFYLAELQSEVEDW